MLYIPILPPVRHGKGRKTYEADATIKRGADASLESVTIVLNQAVYDLFSANAFQMKTVTDGEFTLVQLVTK
jgi:hypothetical protein